MSDYLERIIIPYFKNIREQSLFSILFDRQGKILMSTNKSAKMLGLEDDTELIGISYREINPLRIIEYNKTKDKRLIDGIQSACVEIDKIIKEVIISKKSVTFVNILPYMCNICSFTTVICPLFDYYGEIVAVQLISNESSLFGIKDYFELLAGKSSNTNLSKNYIKTNRLMSDLNLTAREQEILFLISNGLTQEETSKVIGITRGTIAKTIQKQICPKFNMHSSIMSELIKKAKALNLNHYLPLSLLKPAVIVLN